MDVRPQNRNLRVAFERSCGGEALEQHAGERVFVSAPVDRLPLDLLGGDVVERAHELPGRGQAGLRRRLLGETEVGDVHMIVLA